MMSETDQLVEVLNRIAGMMEHVTSKPYTLTGASDWPILLVVGSVLGGVLVAIIGFMWSDLKATIQGDRNEGKEELKRQCDCLWGETRSIRAEIKECKSEIERDMKDCQEDCCPRRVGK